MPVVPTLVSASESPDRECCDGPTLKLDPGSGADLGYPRYNYPPPEVPDFPEYGPHELPPRVPGYGSGSGMESASADQIRICT